MYPDAMSVTYWVRCVEMFPQLILTIGWASTCKWYRDGGTSLYWRESHCICGQLSGNKGLNNCMSIPLQGEGAVSPHPACARQPQAGLPGRMGPSPHDSVFKDEASGCSSPWTSAPGFLAIKLT